MVVLATEAPTIDGVLDEAVWASANVVDQFVQQEPREGLPATDRTEVRVLYDKGRLFIGVRAYASLPVTATEMRRDADRLFDEDNFQIIVDTFHDSRNGYMFLTTPLGAKLEQQVFDEGEGVSEGAGDAQERHWRARPCAHRSVPLRHRSPGARTQVARGNGGVCAAACGSVQAPAGD